MAVGLHITPSVPHCDGCQYPQGLRRWEIKLGAVTVTLCRRCLMLTGQRMMTEAERAAKEPGE